MALLFQKAYSFDEAGNEPEHSDDENGDEQDKEDPLNIKQGRRVFLSGADVNLGRGDLFGHIRMAARLSAGLPQVGRVDFGQGIRSRPDVMSAMAACAIGCGFIAEPDGDPVQAVDERRYPVFGHPVFLHDFRPGVAGRAGIDDFAGRSRRTGFFG